LTPEKENSHIGARQIKNTSFDCSKRVEAGERERLNPQEV